MCNYFGGSCSGPTEEDMERYSDQANLEYQAMLAQHQPTREYNEYLAESLKPDPKFYKPSRIKKGWLTQDMIDNGPQEPTRRLSCWRKALAWLEGVPGWMLTAAVLISFLAGMWGVYLLWTASQAVNTAVKG